MKKTRHEKSRDTVPLRIYFQFNKVHKMRDFLEASNRYPRADLTAVGVERNSAGGGCAPRAAGVLGPTMQYKNSKHTGKGLKSAEICEKPAV